MPCRTLSARKLLPMSPPLRPASAKHEVQAPDALVGGPVNFVSGGFGFGAIFPGGPPVLSGSVAKQVAATVGLPLGGPLVTFSYLLVQLCCSIAGGRAIARRIPHIRTIPSGISKPGSRRYRLARREELRRRGAGTRSGLPKTACRP